MLVNARVVGFGKIAPDKLRLWDRTLGSACHTNAVMHHLTCTPTVVMLTKVCCERCYPRRTLISRRLFDEMKICSDVQANTSTRQYTRMQLTSSNVVPLSCASGEQFSERSQKCHDGIDRMGEELSRGLTESEFGISIGQS